MKNKKPWWMCLLEWDSYCNNPDWELVHDGQRNPGQFEFPPKDVRYFTRKYRSKKRGGWDGLVRGVTFQYDLRTRSADIIKVEFVSEDNKHRKSKELFELSQRRGRT